MLRVDFTGASLRSVEFRGLDLANVIFPMDEDHILIDEYPETLDRVLQALKGRSDSVAKMLTGYFEVYRKWVGPKQRKGILNKNDLLETVGEEGLRIVLELIESARRTKTDPASG